MFINYITVAFRNLLRNKFSTLIKMFSLSVGMICFAVIALFVHRELSYDQFHEHPEQIYRVVKDFVNQDGSTIPDATTPPALAPALWRDLPEVASATRVFPNWGRKYLLEVGDVKSYEEKVLRIDSSFFEVFSFPFVKGDKETALASDNFILLTASAAKRYFRDEDPIGKAIKIDLAPEGVDFFVTGVLKDVPQNSHFTFDFLISVRSFQSPTLDTNWGWYNYYTYARLHPDASITEFNAKLQPLYKKYRPEGLNQFYAQAITDIHLKSNLKWELGNNGDASYINILITIALFVMVLAAINYINLVTAQSAKRAKEVGVRKVSGAGQKLLVSQFLIESVILTMIATVISVAITEMILPLFQDLFGGTLSFLDPSNQIILYLLLGVGLVTGLLAGIYPALYISSFKPVSVLKGVLSRGSANVFLRKGLVTFQFVISTVLIIGTLVITNQIDFMRSKNIGFNKDNILMINNAGRLPNRDALLNEIRNVSNVVNAGGADGVLGGQNWTTTVSSPADENALLLNFLAVDYEFLDAMGVDFKEGRNFSKDFLSDSSAVIINTTAAHQLGLKEPIVGTRIILGSNRENPQYITIVGLVNDFHFTSFHDPIKPFGFFLTETRINTLFVKIAGSNISGTVDDIQKVWNRVVPDRPFEFTFQDEQLAKLYSNDQKFQKLFSYFTFVAITIACLGLLGLSLYTAQQRVKEIGIRKVLGASVLNISSLLSKEFLFLVGIAVIISVPVAWYLMNQWLENFAYRIELSGIEFFVAGLVAISIALATISFQCIKAATANPVNALKDQ